MVDLVARIRDTQGNLAERLASLAVEQPPDDGEPGLGVVPPAPPPVPPPDEAVVVHPDDKLQEKLNDHPAGTPFRLLAGTHSARGVNVLPRHRQRLYGELDANGWPLAELDFAWKPDRGLVGATGVEVHNLVPKRYLYPRFQGGAAIDFLNKTAGLISNVRAREGIGHGIRVGPSRAVNCSIDHASHSFAGGDDASETIDPSSGVMVNRQTDALVEHFTIRDVGGFDPLLQEGYRVMVDGELGRWDTHVIKGEDGLYRSIYNLGWKFAVGERATVRYGVIERVNGGGVWFDIENYLAEVYGVLFKDSMLAGFHWEISFGGLRVHHCEFDRVMLAFEDNPGHVNAWAVQVGESPGIDPRDTSGYDTGGDPRKFAPLPIEFDHCIVRSSPGGLGCRQSLNRANEKIACRDQPKMPAVYKRCCNVLVHDNLVDDMLPGAFVAGVSSGGSNIVIDPSYNIKYRRNHYRGIPNPKPFKWGGQLTWQQWRALGQDEGGTFQAA